MDRRAQRVSPARFVKPMEQNDPVAENAILVRQIEAADLFVARSTAAALEQRDPPVVPETVEQWERFEAGVANSKAYRDPFRDVRLS